MWVYRERCVRFERIIHSICADFAPQRLLFFRHYTMPYAHQSKRRAYVRVKTSRIRVKDLTAICNSGVSFPCCSLFLTVRRVT